MNELAKLNFARQALAEAKSLNEIREVRDIARAVKAYTIAKGLGIEMKNEASEIEIRAIREMGKLIQEKQESGEIGTQNSGRPVCVPNGNTYEPLSDIGITRKESSTSKNLASITDDQFEALISEVIEDKKPLTKTSILRSIAKERTEENINIPEGKYRIIYADPPWQYSDRKEYRPDGSAENHYPTMSISEICNVLIPITEDNAVLFLWVTSPLLEESFKVINAWGFKYKTSFIWDKVKHNMGHYNSVRHEFLLIATKGSCLPDNKTLYDSVQTIERSNKHSEKPKEFIDIINSLYTHGRRIELFARDVADGWEGYGNQL